MIMCWIVANVLAWGLAIHFFGWWGVPIMVCVHLLISVVLRGLLRRFFL